MSEQQEREAYYAAAAEDAQRYVEEEAPAALSPVEPPSESRCIFCGVETKGSDTACDACHDKMVAAGARPVEPAPPTPAPCVWREVRVTYGNHTRDEIQTSCGLSEDADEMRPLTTWPCCPQCGHPLEITR